MGLLDDAIREHLELMRRHGADAAEVQQLEHEAFGPIRRDREFAKPVASPAADAPADPQAVPGGDEPTRIQPPASEAAEPDAPVADDLEATRIYEQPVMPEPPGHEPVVEEVPPQEGPAAVEERPAAVPMREPPQEPEPPASSTGSESEPRGFAGDELWLDEAEEDEPAASQSPAQETTAFSAADVAAAQDDAEAGTADEDVLEETPDFLQETPEHERLWFEQRPPRNFDFDQ